MGWRGRGGRSMKRHTKKDKRAYGRRREKWRCMLGRSRGTKLTRLNTSAVALTGTLTLHDHYD